MDPMPVTVDHLAGLDDEQREAVLAARGPVCVLAGAGTGKTRTITHRIAHLVASGHVAAGQVLAVTFTSRAAGEMRSRLRAMDAADSGVPRWPAVQALTFHAAARRQLQYFWPRVVGDTGWQLLDSKFAVVAQAATARRLQVSTDDVRDLAGEIEWAKASLISPEDYAAAVAEDGPRHPTRRREGGRRLRRLRDAQGQPRRHARCSTSTTCCCTPPPPSRTTPRSPRSSATATAASSSTSTRTSPRCSSGCSTPGSATATT